MRYVIESAERWHELRASRLGASEVAALFGCGYQTHFELWHEKKGDLPHPDYTDNERVVLGRCLEAGIADAASILFDYKLRKADAYYTDDACVGLGATPDYFLVRDEKDFPAEVKNASWGSFKDNWIVHEDGFTEPPLRFSLQVQTQLACTGAAAGLLVALISGDRIVRCEIPRHDEAIAEIRSRTRAFWDSIERNEEPPAEMPGDFDAAKRVWRGGEGKVDLRGDPDIEQWLEELRELRQIEKRIADDEGVIKGRILEYVTRNKYSSVSANAGSISYKWREATKDEMRLRKGASARGELRVTTR